VILGLNVNLVFSRRQAARHFPVAGIESGFVVIRISGSVVFIVIPPCFGINNKKGKNTLRMSYVDRNFIPDFFLYLQQS